MNPRQLEAFRFVMITGSMTLAAEMLDISQPAVSRLIRDLELALSLRLFRREGNRLVPGQEARLLFTEVDRFYTGLERIAKVARSLRNAHTGRLRVASMHTLSLSAIAEGISEFSAARPEVQVSHQAFESVSVLELTAALQFDIGFAQIIGNEYPGLTVMPMPSADAVCILPPAHRLARRKVVRARDLNGERFISLGRNSPMRARVDAMFLAEQVECEHMLETSLAPAACTLVAANLGVTIVDRFTASYFKNKGTVWRRFEPSIPFEFAMVLPAHQPRSVLVSDFMTMMERRFREAAAMGAVAVR